MKRSTKHSNTATKYSAATAVALGFAIAVCVPSIPLALLGVLVSVSGALIFASAEAGA